MSDPLFSWEALLELNTVKERPARRNKVKDFLTVSGKKAAADDKNDKKKPPHCSLCNSSHDLDECRNFNEIEVEERSKFLSKQKLCDGCYEKISQSHTACNLPVQRTCTICAGKHTIGLHGFKLKRKGDDSSDDNKASEIIKVIVSMSVMPSLQKLALVRLSVCVWYQSRFSTRNLIRKSSPLSC